MTDRLQHLVISDAAAFFVYEILLKGDYSRLASYKGEAAVEGWGKGGAIQYELSLTVEQLERLGLLREIN